MKTRARIAAAIATEPYVCEMFGCDVVVNIAARMLEEASAENPLGIAESIVSYPFCRKCGLAGQLYA